MENTLQNHIFNRLWEQAGVAGHNRRIDRAKSPQGRRAIKFKTDGLHKVLILEKDSRPGFEVRICDFPEKPGLVSPEGVVAFASPVETTSLENLIRQVDEWAHSFETIFGEIGTPVPVVPTPDSGRPNQDAPGDNMREETAAATQPSPVRTNAA